MRFVAGKFVEKILPILPWISVLGICHNLLGYLFGYLAGRVGRGSDKASRTTAIEVGMQNSALAATLAKTHFTATPETALPAAVFSVWHNLSGALLAMFFRRWKNGGQA